jgi:hypothetical protein
VRDAELDPHGEGPAEVLAVAPPVGAGTDQGRDDEIGDGQVRVEAGVAEHAAVYVGRRPDRGAEAEQLPAGAEVNIGGEATVAVEAVARLVEGVEHAGADQQPVRSLAQQADRTDVPEHLVRGGGADDAQRRRQSYG